ncbi:MAG TPA: hypothetical protein VMD79_06135 [Solirubrobacteraceae bacterium]|nr:hypothetical protein [Solirubrobacteraceae bacterium]
MLVRATLIALGVLAHPAVAHGAIIDSDPVAEAVTRAVEYWGGTPCAGSVTVVAGPDGEAPPAGANAPSPRGTVAAMWATWTTPEGANQFFAPSNQPIPPATFSDCVVHINSNIWPTWQADDRGFAGFCKEMLHEYGHFEGYPDTGAAPDTIEYERPDLAHIPICESYRLIYGHHVYTPSPRTRGRRRNRRPRSRAPRKRQARTLR